MEERQVGEMADGFLHRSSYLFHWGLCGQTLSQIMTCSRNLNWTKTRIIAMFSPPVNFGTCNSVRILKHLSCGALTLAFRKPVKSFCRFFGLVSLSAYSQKYH